MGELIFIGLGLADEFDISLRGFEIIREADFVFAEFYTSLMPGFSLDNFKKITRKEIKIVNRKNLEEEKGETILKKAKDSSVAFLVPGDPLIATTHIDLRIRAEEQGINTRIVHGASIISAVVGLSGLQNYRFGKSVTIPFPEGDFISETPSRVIAENKARDLHTLCFLDIRVEENKFMTIKEALESLLIINRRKKQHIVTLKSLAVSVARAGVRDVVVRADYVKNLMNYDFGAPPHTLIFPANKLHFIEAEALINLAYAPEQIREMVK